jgi:hypothetical protein
MRSNLGREWEMDRRPILIPLCAFAFGLAGCGEGNGWERVNDPTPAHAFSVEVPTGGGWAHQLSTVVRSQADITHHVGAMKMTDDGVIYLFMGDPFGGDDSPVKGYVAPNVGTQIGSQFSSQFLGQPLASLQGLTIGEYQSGLQVALTMSAKYGSRFCQDAKRTEYHELPQLAATVGFGIVGYTVSMGDISGECAFQLKGQSRAGAIYAVAATQKATQQTYAVVPWMVGGAMQDQLTVWSVTLAMGYFAPKQRAGEAAETLMHMASSFQFDPAYVQGQQQGIAAVTNQLANVNTAVFKSISDSHWYRQAMLNRTFAQGSEARRGAAWYRNRSTGKDYELDNRGYKWVHDSGTVVTTVTGDAPGPGFHPLEPLAPGSR